MEQAQRLADHKENDRLQGSLKTLVLDIQDVYNVYSGGQQDPYAIRNALLDLYLNNGDEAPKYCLLIGDGSYDYKNISGDARNFIPQFEISANGSYAIIDTRNTDDPFVYLSGDNDYSIDMALGRFCVNSQEEVKNIVDKIIDYEMRNNPGDWQGRITLIADDPTHPNTNEREFIENTENQIYPLFPKSLIRDKIYLTEFPEVYDPTIRGSGRVGAREAIIEAFNQGTSLINWIGHGSPTVWAQEYVFVKDRDFPLLENKGMYPMIVAATCDWGRSDYISSQSAAEGIVNLPEAGAIASFASTRPVYDSANKDLLLKFYKALFKDASYNSASIPIGEAIVKAKIIANNYLNTSKFILIGDPSLKLAIPNNNGMFSSLSKDTLSALAHVQFQAELLSEEGFTLSGNDYTAELELYDSGKEITREYRYLGSSGYITSTLNYILDGNRLFKGIVSVDQGKVLGNFIIPKDISYQGNKGVLRIQYYNNDHSTEGLFSQNDLIIQGSSKEIQVDFTGPVFKLFLNDTEEFVSGDAVSDTTTLRLSISDPNGINITGSIGHSINLTINDGDNYDLSRDFNYHQDSYTAGEITIKISDYFNVGENSFDLSAFDNYNNFSSIAADITVLQQGESILTDIVNFPNPFKNETTFTFQSGAEGEAELLIFTAHGQKITEINDVTVSMGFNTIYWDGRDTYGQIPAAGLYLYILKFKSMNDDIFEERGSCIKLP